MNTSLTPFEICQNESIKFLASGFHRGCGDAPGLGKTVTAIKAADLVAGPNGYKFVVCPAGVRSNWYNHIEEHQGDTRGWDVISYNGASDSWKTAHFRERYDVGILDEAHFCKEAESRRTQAVFGPKGLIRRASYKWPLSGTFAPNGRPVEYWPMLKTLHSGFADMSYATYTRLYCGGFFDGREWNAKGHSRVDDFKVLLDQFIISHTKAQAFPGRTAPIVSRVGVDLSLSDLRHVTQKEGEILGREAKLSPSKEDYSQMGDSASLRRLLGEAMVKPVAEFVRTKLEGVPKVVLYFQHTNVGNALAQALKVFNPVVYEGGLGDEQKDQRINLFSKWEECRVFIAQQQAAGTGINGLQQVCSTAVFAEPDWTPGETEQRIDRLDRMGAAGDVVNAYILFARGTLSATILGVHDRKDVVRLKLQ